MTEIHQKSSDLCKAGLANSNNALKRDWQTPFAVILLFLILIVPLRQLSDKIAELQRKSDGWSTTTRQARLNEELVQFRNDLNPEAWVKGFVDSRLDKLDLAGSFSALTGEESPYLRSQALNSIYASVNEALAIGASAPQPLFLVVADDRVQEFRSTYAEQFRLNSSKNAETALFLSCLALRSTLDRLEPSVQERLENYARGWGSGHSVRQGLGVLFRSLISNYKGRGPENRKVRSYLTDLYGFSELYFYVYALEDGKKLTGLVVLGYLSSDINCHDILRQAVENSAGKSIRRLVSKRLPAAASVPGKSVFEKLPPAMLDEEALYAGVVMMEPEIRAYTAALLVLKLLGGLIVLAGSATFWHSLLFGITVRLSLRKKLMIILALALFLPAVLVVVIGRGISNDYLSSRTDMAQNYLSTALDELELTYMECASRLTLNHMHVKLGLNEYWKNGLQKLPEPEYMLRFLDSQSGRNFVYDRSGRSVHYRGAKISGDPDRIMTNNAVRLLNNLSGLEVNSRTRRQLENLDYTDGFVEQMTDNLFLLETSAAEGEVVANLSSPNVLAKEIYHLYADAQKRPVRPETVGFLHVRQDDAFRDIVKSDPKYPHRYFVRRQNEYMIDIGMASRDNEYLVEEFWLDFSQRRPAGVKKLFEHAMELRSSGNLLSEETSDSVAAWRFLIDRQVIYAGTATFSADSLLALYLDIMPFAVLGYSLLILLLISEVLTRLFVSPLEVVSRGVKAVAEGEDLTLRLHIANNDEFDQMGHAFNAMTAGLLQKRHISRFVSDRLLTQVAQAGATGNLAEDEVTVLASDLRNFTGISETYPPEVIVEVLNDYFTEMEEAIKAEGGSIDKFIGDAIIAVFYAQGAQTPSLRACRAAFAMRRRLTAFNQRQQLAGKFIIDNGVGLATGMVLSASIGEESGRREFVVTGATVARAEELEALSKLGRHSKIVMDSVTCSYITDSYKMSALGDFADIFEMIEQKSCD
ncbi:MAG: hypothetical protein ACD_39C00063G0003 [uncultured bacterium]|nr:MAG: hypothetical protein ACD_39C00063G0003 [uncultured bacterium]